MRNIKSGGLFSMIDLIICFIVGCSSSGSDKWTKLTPLPTARAELGVATVNGKIYAIGGISGSTLPFVEEYDPITNTWTSKANMPTARRLLVVAAVNNKIYAIGGVNGSTEYITYTNVTEEYDPSSDTWTTKSPFPVEDAPNNLLGNQYIGGAAANGKIYIAVFSTGGDTAQGPTCIYDPSTDTWDTGEPVPFTYTRLSATSLNDTSYVLASETLEIAKYDANSDVWLLVSTRSANRNNAQLVAANEKLYVIGGISNSGHSVVSTVEEFDTSTNKWQKKESMPTARHSAGLVALDGDIYVIGGSDNPSTDEISALSSVEVRRGDLSQY